MTASDSQAGDRFGWSVAVSGDTAVVGKCCEDEAAYTFGRDEGGLDNWGEVKKLTASDAQAGDRFGWSVAVSGDAAVVGATREDSGGYRAGAAYGFDLLLPKSTPAPTATITPQPTITPKPKDPSADTDGDTILNSDDLDDDNDGCTDLREFAIDATLGGRRNPHNPWDFYDVAGSPLPPQNGAPDGVIDLPNDILGVIQHFAPLGTEPEYDVNFDRRPSAGPNPWNMTAPDGVIDLPNDILGVIQQFNHRCV